jgi:cellulose biosynthesis protein BcsQ
MRWSVLECQSIAGGTGKITVVLHLTVAATHQRLNILIIDLELQASAANGQIIAPLSTTGCPTTTFYNSLGP